MRLLIDCDPGIDDAIALCWAERSPDVDIVGVSLVGGNNPLESVVANAAGLRDFLGASWPLGVGLPYGASGPPMHDGAQVHGDTGLGDVVLSGERPARTAQEILEMDADAVLALGPLSNLAAWRPAAPIIAMGGAVDRPGNVRDRAEFNMWADAIGARDVFAAGPIRVVPLDVTMQVLLEDRHVAMLAAGNEVAALCARMASHYVASYKSYGYAGAGMHDPLAVILAAYPDLATWEQMSLDVGLEGGERGALRRAATGYPVEVAMQVDADAALAVLLATLLD